MQHPRTLILALGLAACPSTLIEGTSGEPDGSSEPDDSTGDSAPAETTTGDPSPTSGPSTVGESSTTTLDPPTGTASTIDAEDDGTSTTGEADSTSSTSSASTTDADTSTGPIEPLYSVYCYQGAPCEKFVIRKQDHEADRCTLLYVARGESMVFVSTPDRWGSEAATMENTAKCYPEADGEEPGPDPVLTAAAASGVGQLFFEYDGNCPSAFSFNTMLTFDVMQDPWAVEKEQLVGSNVPVLGCE